MTAQNEFEIFLRKIQPELEKMRKRHKVRICVGCGEKYHLDMFRDQELPQDMLEEIFDEDGEFSSCGECGCEQFIIRSKNPLLGFESIKHYNSFMEILPNRLSARLNNTQEFLEIVKYKQAAAYLAKER